MGSKAAGGGVLDRDRPDERRAHDAAVLSGRGKQDGDALVGAALVFAGHVQHDVVPAVAPVVRKARRKALGPLGEDEEPHVGSLSDEEGFDSEDVLSDESPEEGDSDFDEDKEDRAERLHAERLSARRKRQRAEDLAVEATSKNKRLPVRGEAGTWLEGDEGDEDSEGDEDAEGLPDEQVGKGMGKSSRATHPVQLADAPSSDEDSEADEEEERHQEPVSISY